MTKGQRTLLKKRPWLFVAAALLVLAGLMALGRDQICRLFVPILFENDGPARADIIFVLGGDNELRGPLAARLLQEGWAPQILLTRQKDQPKDLGNQTDLLRDILLKQMVKPRQIVEIKSHGGVDSTADEARALKDYAKQHPMNRVLVVTSSFHGHRARMAMERALAHTGIEVRVVTAESKLASREHWRDNKTGRIQIESESIKILYYFFTFFG